ncbi:MAG: iron-sulfur cluster co-chaperone HscB C-terminal domain-containing protein [Flavipsychrobacter sp.]
MVNYFQLYALPESFHPPIAAVKVKFYELSRSWHPDRFAQADAAAQAEALRMAALNNEAYKTLSNPDALMAYILKLHGMLEDEEKYNLPPDFLMDMMELNELISEYEIDRTNEESMAEAREIIESEFREWDLEVAPLTQRFNEGEHTEALLAEIKDYYFRRKYLLRIQERIATFAAPK